MNKVKVRPVEIIGRCPAGVTTADEFVLDGIRIENARNSVICLPALSQIPIGQGIWQVQNDERIFSHVSCPGCISEIENENRVVFLLGHSDKWELCQTVSEYMRLRKKHIEPRSAAALRNSAMEQQNSGEFAAAAETMKAAIRELSGGGDTTEL